MNLAQDSIIELFLVVAAIPLIFIAFDFFTRERKR